MLCETVMSICLFFAVLLKDLMINCDQQIKKNISLVAALAAIQV